MIAEYMHAIRRFGRDVRLYLFITATLGFTTFGGIYPVLFNLYLLRLGYGPEYVGLINSVSMLTFAACSLPVGALSRRWGVRRTMIVGLSLATVAYGVMPLGEFMPLAVRSGWLLANYFLRAVGFALYWVNTRPFLMEVTSPKERNHVYSAAAAISPLAGFAGSLIAGVLPGFFAAVLDVPLDHPAPYRYPLWMAVVFLLPAVLALAAMRELHVERGQERVRGAASAPFGLFILLALALTLQSTGSASARSFFNVYLDDGLQVSTSKIGLISAIGQLLAALTALSTPPLAAWCGNARVYLAGSLGIALSLLPLALIPHWMAAGSGFLGVMALASITMPAINVYQMELVAPRWRTAMSGVTAMAFGLSSSTITLAGGHIIATLGYRPFFLTAAGLTVAGALLFGAYFRIPRGELACLSEERHYDP